MKRKEKYTLAGIDGNAYTILGYVQKSMREENRPKAEITSYLEKATSADYDNLVSYSMYMTDQLNRLVNGEIGREQSIL